jgi:hypothetical protein
MDPALLPIVDFGLEHVYSDDDPKKAKRKVRPLVEGIRPPELKTVVKRKFQFGSGVAT